MYGDPSPLTYSRLTMMNNYELTIYVSSPEGFVWSDTHRFPARPETDTIKALLAVAYETFDALYDTPIESCNISLDYMNPMDRKLEGEHAHEST